MVDILLATYNGEKYIQEQIESLLEQTYKDIKILIRDDGSTDRTVDIIKELEISNSEIIKLIQDDKELHNPTANFFELCKHSTSDYIMFCDQDDYWFPDKVERSLKEIKKAESNYPGLPILAYGNYIIANKDLEPIGVDQSLVRKQTQWLTINHLLVQSCVTGCLCIINKALKDLMGEYSKDILMHDWWLSQLAAATGKVIHFDDEVMYYRQHEENVVGAVDTDSAEYVRERAMANDIRANRDIMIKQARVLAETVKNVVPKEKMNVINAFIKMQSCSKIKRLYLLIRFGLWKEGLARKVSQIIFY